MHLRRIAQMRPALEALLSGRLGESRSGHGETSEVPGKLGAPALLALSDSTPSAGSVREAAAGSWR
jgi:hypothetical protein